MTSNDTRGVESNSNLVAYGDCPNCSRSIAVQAKACTYCSATFGVGSAWKVTPSGQFGQPPAEPVSEESSAPPPVRAAGDDGTLTVLFLVLGAIFLGAYFLIANVQGEYGSQTMFKDRLRIQYRISDDDADRYIQTAKVASLIGAIACVVGGFVRLKSKS